MKRMNKRISGIIVAMFAFMFLLTTNIYAQEKYTVSDDSKMVIKGTSTIHDWESKVTEINGSGVFSLDNQAIESVKDFQLSVPVKSIESGKKGMDNKIYEALNADKTPKIDFVFEDAKKLAPGKLQVNGKMTIAGNTKDVQLTSDYKVENGQIVVNGSYTTKMTNFNVDPPTAMLGAVKSGDQIQIEYNLILVNGNNLKTSK